MVTVIAVARAVVAEVDRGVARGSTEGLSDLAVVDRPREGLGITVSL